MKSRLLAFALSASFLTACGVDPSPLMVAAGDTTLAANPTVMSALANTTGKSFTFASGVPDLGTSAATTVTITNDGTAQNFDVSSGSQSASGVLTYGSCIFTVTRSTYAAGHPLALGARVTVNPCSMSVNTTGAVANGVAVSRSVALVLGAATSANSTVTIGVNANGGLALNGALVTTIQLTPGTGGS